MMRNGYGMAVMWPLMILFAALAIAGLIALILVIIRLARTDHEDVSGANNARASARRILDERYARGEIDHDEYRERRDNLQ